MLSAALSVAWLAAISGLGIVLIGRLLPILRPLERVAFGAPFGMVVGTIALVPVASVVGFSGALVALDGIVAAAIAVWLARGRAATSLPPTIATRPSLAGALALLRRAGVAPTLVIGFFAVRWAFFWRSALSFESDGLWAGHINIWGDWPVHLGIVSSFAFGGNFPPEHPRFAEHVFSYHYLADLSAAAMTALGMEPGGALQLHSWVGSVLVLLAVYALARRLVRDRTAATVALVLFVLGSGLAWFATVIRIDQAHDVVGVLLDEPWDRNANTTFHIRWVNMFFGFLASQRAFLYGIPMAAAIVIGLMEASRRRDLRLFVGAGIVAGLLPLAHLPTLLALAIVVPFLFFAFPSRGWVVFGVVWVAIAVPQLLVQQGGSAGALASFRWHFGWVADPDPWWWFWIKGLGWFLPLALAGFFTRGLLPERSRRFLWAFGAIFVAANVAVFQPWDWDNHKILVYFFLAVAIVVGALVVRTWRTYRGAVPRLLLATAVASMILSGTLEDLGQWEGHSRFNMLSAEEVELAGLVRDGTPARSLFITGMENHDPIAMLSGRRILMGYEGWLWTEGIDYRARLADVRAIYRFDPGAEDLLASYQVDYVVIGPHERADLGADEAAFAARYPAPIATRNYRVYAIGSTARPPAPPG